MTITVTSSLFGEGDTIPTSAAHAATGGDNVSPDLSWTPGPVGTQSYAVTCHDPDAPTTVGFTHWVVLDVPPDVTALPAGAGDDLRGVQGITDWGENGWGGMAPPPGDDPHHYVFTVYALDTKLGIGPATPYAKLRFVIRGHVLDEGSLTGRFGLD